MAAVTGQSLSDALTVEFLDGLVQPIVTVLNNISVDEVPNEHWDVKHTPSKYAGSRFYRRSFSNPFTGTDTEPGQSQICVFVFEDNDWKRYTQQASWIGSTNFIAIQYGTHYRKDHPTSPGKVPSADSARGAYPEQYTVTGAFVNPICTGDPRTAADAVTDAFNRAELAAQYNDAIELIDGASTLIKHQYDSEDDIIDELLNVDWTEQTQRGSPVRVSGVGDKTLNRFASTYGTYWNIATLEPHELYSVTSSLYNKIDPVDIIENARLACERYAAIADTDTWPRDYISPEQFTEYPVEKQFLYGKE